MASSGLTQLPAELLALVISHLPNRDVKILRLTCRLFHAVAKLRFNRVFLSANPRDVEVFLAIADHDTFRKAITEIIWDDAVIRDTRTDRDEERHPADEYDEEEEEEVPGVPLWFSRACDDNNFELKARYDDDPLDRPERAIAAQLPVQESWAYFQKWRRQQQDVISSGADVAALRHGFARFPALRTITITPAVHGYNITFPLYDTPTIRSFPAGFNYPLPRGWPTTEESDQFVVQMPPWANEDGGREDEREKWRGFRIVLRELALRPDSHRVSELIFDSHQLDTGLNCHIFEQPNPEYYHLVSLLRRPGFRRLDLSLSVGGQENQGWSAFRSTFLRRALSEIRPDLEHISLTTDLPQEFSTWSAIHPAGGRITHHIPLQRTIFPVDRWPNLRHFGLAGFLVTQDDLISLLTALPPTLRSLQLGDIYFISEDENWRGFLVDMRDRLRWRDRPVEERPRVVIHVFNVDGQRRPGRAVWLDAEMAEFLYGEGQNPFGHENGRAPNQVYMGRAGTVRDAFDPGYERPFAEFPELIRLGFVKRENYLF